MLTTFKRLLKFGWTGFLKNREASMVTAFVVTLAVFLVSVWIVFQGFSQGLMAEVKNQMGISVYFQREATEQQIAQVQTKLKEQFPKAIKKIQYVSSEEALTIFKKKHAGESLYLKALEEAGPNAIRPSLDITAYQEGQYKTITDYLEKTFPSLIYQVDYLNRQKIIDKAFSLIKRINYFSLTVGLVLVILLILVVFNTVRLAIYSMKDELETMKLVGAPSWFAWGPFVWQGVIYGLIGFVVTDMVFLPLIAWLSPQLSFLLPNFYVWHYYQIHWFVISLIQLGTGIGLGMASMFLATRYYLK